MRRLLPLLLVVASPVVATDPPKKKGTNYAFLVGAAGYEHLQKIDGEETVNDVIEFRKVLLATGFRDENIVLLHDRQSDVKGGGKGNRYLPEHDKIVKELDLFLDGLTEQDTVVVALSGHGVLFKGDKFGYFCPTDAKLNPKTKLIPMDGDGGIYTRLEKCKAGRKLLIANTCRDAPSVALRNDLAGDKIDLADDYPEVVPKGIAAFFSCSPGQKSYFDPKRGRSLFFIHLTSAWAAGGSLEAVFDATRTKTKADANANKGEKQAPVLRHSYEGEWSVPEIPDMRVENFEWKGKPRTRVVRTLALGGEKMEFVLVPPGKFTMGSPDSDKNAAADEKPQHTVTFTEALWVAKYPVTKGQFAAFVKATKYATEAEADGKGGRGFETNGFKEDAKFNWTNTGWEQTDRHPVVFVTWNDAQKYCEWAAKESKVKVRLLSEAEYEYANRGGADTIYFTGDDVTSLEGYANVADKSAKAKFAPFKALPFDDGEVFTSPVGKYKPNGFGLHDTTGNVWSWCADRYDAKAYQRGDVTDLPVHTETGQKNVAVRGGGWDSDPGHYRAALRVSAPLGYRQASSGFRVCFRPD